MQMSPCDLLEMQVDPLGLGTTLPLAVFLKQPRQTGMNVMVQRNHVMSSSISHRRQDQDQEYSHNTRKHVQDVWQLSTYLIVLGIV